MVFFSNFLLKNQKKRSAQAFGSYFLLAATYGCCLLFRGGGDGQNFGEILKSRGWRYFLLALIDVEVWAFFRSFFVKLKINAHFRPIISWSRRTSTQTSRAFRFPIYLIKIGKILAKNFLIEKNRQKYNFPKYHSKKLKQKGIIFKYFMKFFKCKHFLPKEYTKIKNN